MTSEEAYRMMAALDADAPRAAIDADRIRVSNQRGGKLSYSGLLSVCAALSIGAPPCNMFGSGGGIPGRIVKTKRQPNARTMGKRRHSKREARRVAELARAKQVYCHECSLAGGAERAIYHSAPACESLAEKERGA